MLNGKWFFSPWAVLMAVTLTLIVGLGIVGSGQTATTTQVSSSANPSSYGESVTFTITVYEGTTTDTPIQTPSGTVSLYHDDILVESKDLADEPPFASVDFDICFLLIGTHRIRADYSGYVGTGYEYASSSDSMDQVVNERASTVTVSDVKDYGGSSTAAFSSGSRTR